MTVALAQAIPPPIIKTRQLTMQELESLNLPLIIQGNNVHIERSLNDWKLKKPVDVPLEKILAIKEKGLVAYILTSFLNDRPNLIEFVISNQSLIKMARHFLRHCSASNRSCLTYSVNMYKFSTWLGYTPDMIISDIKPVGNIPDPQRLQNHCAYLDDYLATLQDDGLKPGAVNNCIKAVKTFYRVNGAKVETSEPLSRRVTYKDRAPKPEELALMIDFAALREKFIISAFALAGFREETLTKLKYRHVKDDLEANVTPIHIHVEADITKGKYHDYDTFLGPEAVHYLKLYIKQRQEGVGTIPPETLNDNSPLIRDESNATIKGIGPKAIRQIVHKLYKQAGLLKHLDGRMYDLRTHSIRKFFKTQLLALGVQPDYVDYMMGHTVDTYHDIQSIGIDQLRAIYAAAGLAIRRKTQVSKVDALKEIIRAWGLNPEQLLAKEALAQGAVTIKAADVENHQLAVLANELKQLIRAEATV